MQVYKNIYIYNQWWRVVHLNKPQWNFNQNLAIFIQVNIFEDVDCYVWESVCWVT